MTYRVAHISDTHLSRDKPYFVENFLAVAAAIAATAPELVINGGDLSLDGVAAAADLVAARRLHAAIALPTRFIAGNHDVGESHDVPNSQELRVSAATRERYIQHFGPDFWSIDIPGWRFIALNSQLLGSELESAGEQLDFVADAAAKAEGRRLALFVHKPLFDASAEETAVTGRFVNPAARRQLLAAFGGREPALVASGHVHQYRSTRTGQTRHVWAPSTGFIIPDARQPRYGDKDVGYVEHRFEPDGSHEAHFVRVPAMKRLDITDFREPYPSKT